MERRKRWLGGFGQGDKWIFCLRAAQIGGGSGEGLTKRTRWNHTPAFEAKMALTALEGEKTLAELARFFEFTRTRSRTGRRICATGRPGCSVLARRVRGRPLRWI
jgi:hypothetical protein